MFAFCKSFHKDIYDFNLSLTQSRRARAGKELENIIQLILKTSDISVEQQGIIEINGFKKIIDLISPSSSHYQINSSKVILISCKTTLRERWQEVIEEIRGIEESKVFLITLDEKFSEHLLEACRQTNIQLVVLDTVKRNYLNNQNVISLEALLEICKENTLYWSNFNSSND